MSVAEFPRASDDALPDRLPPQDIAAEQSVLGAMLLSKDAVADVVETLRESDFYRPTHQTIYGTILDLYSRGEPADAITVAAALGKNSELSRIGGAPYLHTLVAGVPSAANASYYARIVSERAILRRLVEAGTRITQMGYTADGEVDDLVDRAQAEVYDVTERRMSEDYRPLSALMNDALAEIEAIGNRGGEMVGVPTGFADLDRLTNGLHPGQLCIIAARPAIGKALALDTPLPTPTGWTTMGEVRVGDELIDANGRPTRVVAATEVMVDRPCYEIEFSDGSRLVADGQHQWVTSTRAERKASYSAQHLPTQRRLPVSSDVRNDIEFALRMVEASDTMTAGELAALLQTQPGSTAVQSLLREVGSSATRVATKRVRAYTYPARALTVVGRTELELLAESGSVVTLVEVCGALGLSRKGARSLLRRAGVPEVPQTVAARTGRPIEVICYPAEPLLNAARRYAMSPINDQRTRQSQLSRIRTTEQIAQSLHCVDGRANHSVQLAKPLQFPDADLLVPAYTLGVWLGDGTSAAAHFTSADLQIAERVRADGIRSEYLGNLRYSLRRHGQGSVQADLRTLDVLNNKHIPAHYLRASINQRRDLLRGLLDTDGTVMRTGVVQYTTTSKRLADDVHDLIVGLGYRVGMSTKSVAGRSEASSTAFTLSFSTDDDVFGLDRKRTRHATTRGRQFQRRDSRFITRVTRVDSIPVRCVEVDNADHLYLAGRSMIPTHNSTLGLDLARSASIKHGLTSAIFSLEMSRNEIVMRLLSAEAQIGLHNMRSGSMSDADWTRLARKMSAVSEAPLFIDDSPNLTMMEIRAKARRLRQRNDLRLIVVDYLQLMTSGRKVESRQQEVSEFSRQMKLLAKELEVPVVAISQLNRGPEQRTDKKPMLSDLRESGSLEQDADIVVLISREDAYERESPRAGEADFIIAKHRNGPTGQVTVAFQGHYSRFVDMAVT